MRSTAFALLAFVPAILALATCQTLVGVGNPCDRDADCNGAACKDGFCDVAIVGEGEGSGPAGEGEGAEGAEGEGEGAEGEGEGAPGEGEGEGVVGEGEGEGISLPPPHTCKELLAQQPGAPSGPYNLDLDGDGHLDDRNGDGVVDANDAVQCDMTTDGGGWTQNILVTQASIGAAVDAHAVTPCPGDMQLVDHRGDALGFVGCSRQLTGAGARSVIVPALFPYKDILGHVEGIVFGDLDAFADSNNVNENDINDFYVDGVSVTTAAPRQHVWTFVSAHPLDQQVAKCPCVGGTAGPSFVGADLFCDKPSPAARAGTPPNDRHFDPSDPQWDGPDNICAPAAQAPNDPFFHQLGFFSTPQKVDLEVRNMADQGSADEDLAVTHIEIYTRE